MPSGFRLAFLALLWGALATGVAHAQAAPPALPAPPEIDPQVLEQRAAEARNLKSLFGVEAPKARSRACFTRVYDAAHLKAHPHQHIVEIRISAHYDPGTRLTKDLDRPRSKWGYAIFSRLRSGKLKTFLDDGACGLLAGAGLTIRCNAACDAGDDFFVDADGKSAKLGEHFDLVHPEYIEPGGPPYNRESMADDRVFRLYRADDALCYFDKP